MELGREKTRRGAYVPCFLNKNTYKRGGHCACRADGCRAIEPW